MDYIKSLESSAKGTLGEYISTGLLYYLGIKGYVGYPLHNIYLPLGNGEYTEVDAAYVSLKGIFVIESKNYSGWIFGSEADKNWTASLAGGKKNYFYNPILQNKAHIRTLNRLLGYDVPCFSIIVFSDKCELKKISVTDKNVRVIQYRNLTDVITEIWNASPDVLSEARMKEIADSLKACANVDASVKAAHVEAIKKRTVAQNQQKQNTSSLPANSTSSDVCKGVDIMDLVSSVFSRK